MVDLQGVEDSPCKHTHTNYRFIRIVSYSATGSTACLFSILSAPLSGSRGQRCLSGPSAAGDKIPTVRQTEPKLHPTNVQLISEQSKEHNVLCLVSGTVHKQVWYLKHSLTLLQVLWFGLPHTCTTTKTTILTRTQRQQSEERLKDSTTSISPCVWVLPNVSSAGASTFCAVSEVGLVVVGCHVCAVYASSPKLVCLSRGLLKNRSPERGQDSGVTRGLPRVRTCSPLKWWTHHEGVAYLSCVCVFVYWASSCRLCRRCCLSSCCAPAAHRCQAGNSRHSGSSPSMSWDLACLCRDGTALKWTSGQTRARARLTWTWCFNTSVQIKSHNNSNKPQQHVDEQLWSSAR